jgi:zinc protease
MKKFIYTTLLCLLVTLGINISVFAADSMPAVYKLKNGQTAIIKELHANPIVTIDTWVKTGSLNENDKNNGVSHFLEHLMFKGSEKYKTGQFSEIVESKGGKFNAATSKDFTHFYITIPSKDFETAVKLHSDMMINANVPQAELDKERGVVVQEIKRSEDSPESTLFENFINMVFKHHPYRYTTLGPAKNIENISRNEIMSYYHKYYVPSNMTTIVVGDVDPKKTLDLLEKNFVAKSTKPLTLPKYKREPEAVKPQVSVKNDNKYNFGYMIMGFKGVPIKDKKDNYALDIASSILGGGKSSRLYQELKERQNIVSSIDAGHYSLRDDSLFYVSGEFPPENYGKVKVAVEKELKKLANTKVTEEELNRAKTQSQRAYTYENESTSEIAESIGYTMTLDGDINTYLNHIKYINSVTADDIQKAVKKYVKPSSMALSVLLPEKVKQAAIEDTDSPQEINVADVNKTTPNTTESARTPIQCNNNAVATKTVLNNGITLITNPNTNNDIISLSVFVKGGKLLDCPAGITNLLTKTLMQGTTNRSALEITKALEDSGIQIIPVLDSDYFEIKVKSTSADFNKAFEILSDILKNPAFSTEYVEKGKKNILEEIIIARDKPLSRASEGFARAMYPNHPYGNTGEVLEKSVPNLKREDLISFHKKYFIPQNMVVAISGNFSPQDITAKFQNSFAAITGEKFCYKPLMQIEKFKENKNVLKNNNTSAAWMIIGWQAPTIDNTKDYLSLQVINSILGGGLSSRLHNTFREKEGLAYAVGSSYAPRKEKSYFAMYIGTQPKNAELVKTRFLQETARLKTEKISEKELEDAKQKIIGGYLIEQETSEDRAHNLGYFETVDKGFKFTYDFPDQINSITADDIIRTANKYFSAPYILSAVAPEKDLARLK